jgi:transposase
LILNLAVRFDGGVLAAKEAIVERILRSTPEVVGEVLPGLSKRRDFSTVEKLRILAQGTATDSSPALTCRTHGISSGQFYTWRKQFRSGALTGFVPASIASDVAALPSLAPIETPPATPLAGHVEVELPNGVKVRVRGGVDASTLRQIPSALR